MMVKVLDLVVLVEVNSQHPVVVVVVEPVVVVPVVVVVAVVYHLVVRFAI